MDMIEEELAKNRATLERLKAEGAVIGQSWGGLGDNLSFSTLPERLSSEGIECFLSTQNVCRNLEINDLVWTRNPFIKGVVDRPPNAGGPMGDVFDKGISVSLGFIERIELSHGLAPVNSAPKIYYRPQRRRDYTGKILIDLGSVSFGAPVATLVEYVKFVVMRYRYAPADLVQVRFKIGVASKNTFALEGVPKVTVESLYEYCDLLCSVGGFITVHSGAQSLAVALREHNPSIKIHAFALPLQFNWRSYIYKNVEYYVR